MANNSNQTTPTTDHTEPKKQNQIASQRTTLLMHKPKMKQRQIVRLIC
jgi:hypothetical protein